MAEDNDQSVLWIGNCNTCRANYTVEDGSLRATYPELSQHFDDGEIGVACPECEDGIVELVSQRAKVIPFSAWNVLPPDAGKCPECAVDHHPHEPHNQTSMFYQYYFRSQLAKAGQPERWPTWRDAMAHCAPVMQEAWIAELTSRGISVD